MSYLKTIAGVIAIALAVSSANGTTYESIGDGNWTSSSTWKNGTTPGTTLANGDTIFIFHDVFYNGASDLTIKGYLMATTRPGDEVITFSVDSDAGRSIFVESGGEFSIHFANFKMPIYNGTNKGSGSLKASSGGKVSYYYSQCEIAQDWASSGGQRTYRFGCLKTGQNWSNDGSTDTIIGVCIDVGHHGSGNVEFANGSVYITGSSFKGSGTSGNAKFDGTINGDITAIDFGDPSGNIESSSGASGSVALSYYCNGTGGSSGTYKDDGSIFTGESSNCSIMSAIFPCPCDSLYIPHKEILGNLFNDANGMNNDTVDGPGVKTLDATQMYVSLVDSATGRILDVAPVAADGSYSLETNLAGTFYVTMDTDSSGDTTATMPAFWGSTGENHGSGVGFDSTVDGRLYFQLDESDTIIEDLNLAVNKVPQSDDYTFSLNSTPAYNSSMVLNANSALSPISGSDYEDGTVSNGGLFIIADTARMNGNTLYYDLNGNGQLDAGEQLLPNDTLSNYDSSILRVQYSGFGSTFFEFTYYIVDNASALSRDTAQYFVDWPTPIPVELIYFKAELVNDHEVLIKWATAQELNNSHFVIERSGDGLDYGEIGTVQGAGTTSELQRYNWIDGNLPLNQNILYYRLVQFDFDGANETFGPLAVRRNVIASTINIFPNPTDHSIEVLVPTTGENDKQVDIYSVLGVKVMSADIKDSSVKINVSHLPPGSYSIMMNNTFLGRFLVKD